MKITITALMLTGLLCALSFQRTALAAEDNNDQELIKRGEYLTNFGGCNDCHTPKLFTPQGPVPDTSRLLSGHPSDAKLPDIPQGTIGSGKWGALTNAHFTAWLGPWGISFSSNLTPDNKTGMGSWTEEMFTISMRTGKHLGDGRDILPPMPWPAFVHLTDEDIKAIFTYLKSIKPIENAVPQPVPPNM